VLDARSTPRGAPYFVSEYVAGAPITAYCDNQRRSTHERLVLFMRGCEGVQHAHRKAIIHRDLKPPNTLITEKDGKAAPKIMDIGVAKALTQDLLDDVVVSPKVCHLYSITTTTPPLPEPPASLVLTPFTVAPPPPAPYVAALFPAPCVVRPFAPPP
jgi:serine/threonine protein kinase